MEIVLFGLGQIYKENKTYISERDNVIAFLDNNRDLWGKKVDGITVFNPNKIKELSYDKIVLMSIHALKMKYQLLDLGCKAENIVHYKEYICSQEAWELKVKFCEPGHDIIKGRCLIITSSLGYHGGPITALYAALALKQRGYAVTIAAPKGSLLFVEDMQKQGISFICYGNLEYAKWEELFWVNDFRYIIVNTLPMIHCALEIAYHRKVILWLHEASLIYPELTYWKEDIEKGIRKSGLKICAVSPIAKQNFFNFFFPWSIKVLPYGIPDEYVSDIFKKKEKLTFALVGTVHEIKGQDIFIDAIERIKERGNEGVFWIIGNNNLKTEYGAMIERRVTRNTGIQLLGGLTHKELIRYYQKIDVLVIASRQETMSLIATEAMMFGKVCIISDMTGMARYVQDYVNGLTFHAGASKELAERILWCIDHVNQIQKIGENARITYQSNFSMDIFGRNLEEELSI